MQRSRSRRVKRRSAWPSASYCEGVLLYGPPGCGKTLLARAAAGEVGAEFISVGIEEVLDMWIGASERNLHDRFEEARRHTPCVLLFDEVDALGPRRGDIQVSGGRSLVNQFRLFGHPGG